MKKYFTIGIAILFLLISLAGCVEENNNVVVPDEPPSSIRVTIEEWQGESADELEFIYEDDNYRYYLSSIRSDKIMLIFENGEQFSLKEAISQQNISIDDLILNGLQVHKEKRTKEPFLSMTIKEISPSGLTLFFENSSDNEYTYGIGFALYTLNNDTWILVEPIIESWGFNDEGYYIFPNSTTDEEKVDWHWLFGELPSGEYKFQRSIFFIRQPGDFDEYVLEQTFTLEQ